MIKADEFYKKYFNVDSPYEHQIKIWNTLSIMRALMEIMHKRNIPFIVMTATMPKSLEESLFENIRLSENQKLSGIVDYDGKIVWHSETYGLSNNYFLQEAKDLKFTDQKDMARGLRIWAKGCNLLEQHQRRLKASLAHHILKLCDISAATERKEYQKKDEQDYYGGWLMVENIRDYVENIKERGI